MLGRCYTEDYGNTYKDAKVCEEWFNYQTFAEWFYSEWKGNPDVALDKDLLYKGNKIYSPETCSLVPNDLNNFSCKAKAIRGDLPIGVILHDRENITKYAAVIYKFNNIVYLGWYDTQEDAFNKYKVEKELHAKVLADKYYQEGLITEDLRNSLYKYNVEITD